MGVYIPNVEMPRGCNSCPLVMEIDNTCSLTMGGCAKDERPPHCPLIEIDLVRCGECVYADGYNHCVYSAWWNGNADFCSHGIRRKENR